MQEMPPPVKLLCLHGWGQNAAVFRRQARDLLKFLAQESTGRVVQAFVPSAPLHLPPPAAAKASPDGDVETPGRADARAWWYYSDSDKGDITRMFVAEEYHGLEASMAHLRGFEAEHGPFDGVLGFSQGAVAAHVVCCGGVLEHEPKFAVLISGFPAQCEAARRPAAAATLARIPSLHVSGAADFVVEPERQKELANAFGVTNAGDSAGHIWTHPRGHALGLSKPQTRELVSLVRDLALAAED